MVENKIYFPTNTNSITINLFRIDFLVINEDLSSLKTSDE